ncbi:MAG: glycosyltransferase family 2 protein, partial [Flavobacteriaceae bacterium]|nr:glycosyltransferase family 2 protein [Flavobacteriaceae bacterium]
MSNNMPLVSIIIPVFNREGLILETLKSILEQSYQNWECIIVDDHSTDGTYTVISDYIKEGKKISLVKRPENKIKGACSCRNHGYKLSNGDYINWFDSDDIMHQDFLLLKVQKLLSSETIDGVVSKTAFFKDDYRELFDKEKRTILTGTLLEDFIALKVSWYLPDVLWKKTFLIGKDLFDEELLMGQDRIFHIK